MSNKPQRPYIEDLQSTLDVTKMMKELLEKRIELGMLEMKDKNDFEANEIKILLIRTRGEIDSLKKIISEKEDYFKRYVEKYEKDAAEMKENYDKTLQIAYAKKESNPAIKHTLDEAKWDLVNDVEQFKVSMYKRLKNLIAEK